MTRIELPGRPLDINRLSSGSHWQISKERKQWRDDAHTLAKYTRIAPVSGPVVVHVRQHCTGRLPDCGSIANAIKAVLDGLVDAGVLVDDSPRYVYGLCFAAAVKDDRDYVMVELEPVSKWT